MKNKPKRLMIALYLIGGFSPLLGSQLYRVGFENAPLFFWPFSLIMFVMATLVCFKQVREKQ